ncbi:radical SAM protein [Actinoplanes sp. NPDC026619]|uniref:B12-binding domain-containing radical SAM protein n=1 Tax=Actinoplanes sp. NPDC026619 TaxID=3155798 RepID=UPI0033D046A3
MHALLLAGLGPTYKNSAYVDGSLFAPETAAAAPAMLARASSTGFTLGQLSFEHGGDRYPLLRPRRDTIPHLTTFTLESILMAAEQPYTLQPLEGVWDGTATAPAHDVDVVLLSTTYIWNSHMLARAMAWIAGQLPGLPVFVGGQYSNLKFQRVMHDHPAIVGVVRGDAEHALPALLQAQRDGTRLEKVPNLVWRDGDRIRINETAYVDIEAFPSPGFPGKYPIVPYESMRGCPFDCKFCSFPAASPKWRYKSAEKIRDDWVRYAEHNDASMIEAMDSTFTVPPTRLRELVRLLPDAGVPWECYSRANVINSPQFIEDLTRSHCFRVQIGFESMNQNTLTRMSKRVTAKQNRRAFELLQQGDLGYTIFFMIGYPGETPEQFEDTRQFLLHEYDGHFMLHLFSVADETMPLWDDREELDIRVDDPFDSDSPWSHAGMSSVEARQLLGETLDQVRQVNDRAVLMLWQGDYQHSLMPVADHAVNLSVEKALERLAMAPRDHPDPDRGATQVRTQLDILRRHGVTPQPVETLCTDPI